MLQTIVISVLFALPGALLFALYDEVDLVAELEQKAKVTASGIRDRSQVHARLDELGRGTERDYQDFRLRQSGYCVSASTLVLVLMLTSNKSIAPTLLLSTLTCGLIYFFIDKELTTQVKKHREAIESQFPAIIEMMALAIAAGETPMQAILRIAQSAEGELSKEFAVVISEVRTGQPLHVTLDSMGRRVKSVMIRRFVDAVITATLRGAPLIEVLSRHAVEARGNQRNRVMNAAGKAEVSMMIPVVFLILPISILFALWPSLTNLNLFAH